MHSNEDQAVNRPPALVIHDQSSLSMQFAKQPSTLGMSANSPMSPGNDSSVFPAYCQGHARFTTEEEVHSFCLQNEIILLRLHPEVFPPSSFGLRFAEQIDFTGCDRSADIGTGTGLLAVLAHKKGVKEIKATDISKRAIEIVEQNARLNEAQGIELRTGHCFCDLAGKFDLITANLPQEIIPPHYRAVLSSLQSQAIDGGGAGGNNILLDFLDIAPRYMHAASKLYIIVNTITDYKVTLRRIEDNFRPDLVWEGFVPTKSFVRENIEFFRKLIDAGIVALSLDAKGDWCAKQYIFCLALKPRVAAPQNPAQS